jgi:preprotein translocase subunit SecD
MKKVMFIISMILVSFSIGIAQTHSDAKQDSLLRSKETDNCQAGFYLIAAEADGASALPAASSEQQVVYYDYKFLQATERGKPRYLLLSKTADVPLILAGKPELQQKGENGFPELRLELTPEAAIKLEKLTREHLGGKVAFVIDGEPVTIHKIRSVITGGQFRLSRCTDTACQYIYGRLMEKR